MTSSGICGSDLHPVAASAAKVTLGQEFGGWTEGGTLVAVRPHLHCGHCRWCVFGAVHLCPRIPQHFHGSTVDGGLAEGVLVAPDCVVPVPDGGDPSGVALVEPIAVAWHAVARSAPRAGLTSRS
ncbi:alcohol dehydrogenase catalytic domain-containing protein [Pseudonocardia sp. NPDC049154]|uniref:alcohol dehydrogenase catalytic domain-containing protein n=1 Tax=Pseudonocardia sp. NPDC049154 TaxID=3155501 RepID=UPI0033FB90D0